MSVVVTANITHNLAVAKAEGIRQGSIAASTTQAATKTADIVHYRSCLSSAVTNGVNPTPFIMALRDLGTGGA